MSGLRERLNNWWRWAGKWNTLPHIHQPEDARKKQWLLKKKWCNHSTSRINWQSGCSRGVSHPPFILRQLESNQLFGGNSPLIRTFACGRKKKRNATSVVNTAAVRHCRASHTSAAAVFNSSDLRSSSFIWVRWRILMDVAASHSPTSTVSEGEKERGTVK